MKVVIVGAGMAGARLAEEIRMRSDARITLFGAEPRRPYNRVLLSGVVAGSGRARQLRVPLPEDVTLRAGVPVVSIDRVAKEVIAGDGTREAYDVCVLATGSEPVMPPVPGIDRTLPFRTLDDCERIIAAAESASRAVVIGGGLLGIEAARGLAGRGLPVTVVHLAGHLMERQLDAEAGDVLRGTLADLGVTVVTGVSAAAVDDLGEPPRTNGEPPRTNGEPPRTGGVTLTDGRVLPADLVVTSCGVRPVTDVAEKAGLEVNRGIVVDDRLRTGAPAIFAIGECAEHAGTVYGLVGPGWEQAAVVASVITGTPAAYHGSRLVTRLKADGVELASLGSPHDGGGAEVVRFSHPARGTYRKLVIRDDRLVGAILLGETVAVGTLTQLYDRGAALPEAREGLLFPGLAGPCEAESPTRMPDSATVCECNGVTKGTITAAWQDGARGVAAVSAATRACTGCGTCRETVEGLLGWLNSQ